MNGDDEDQRRTLWRGRQLQRHAKGGLLLASLGLSAPESWPATPLLARQ
jgi:hypothetical protein